MCVQCYSSPELDLGFRVEGWVRVQGRQENGISHDIGKYMTAANVGIPLPTNSQKGHGSLYTDHC